LFLFTLTAETRVERVPVGQGAELVTVFAIQPSTREAVPIVSILRDSLDDPATERLRKVWVLTYARPNWAQRIAAAFPFYSRTGTSSVSAGHPPAAIMDLSAPERETWTGLAAAGLQSEFLDGEGLIWRAPTRGYRSVSSEYRSMHVAEAVQVLDAAELAPATAGTFPAAEWDQAEARLLLSRKLLGGLVSQSHVSQVAAKQQRATEENRGHNWELLRQRAESNGLYFEPLSLGAADPSYAMLWVSASDLVKNGPTHSFDGSLLKIVDPWTDDRLRHWKGYQEAWYFDGDGAKLDAATPGAASQQMIPLALYSLDYPPSPLLLIDFRDQWKPKAWEILGRTIDYAAFGVLGWTGFGNLSYLAARTSWTFFEHRHGANVDRTTRVSAYAELRHSLFFDNTLDPKLRDVLEKRLDQLAINPFERGKKEDELEIPRKQYAALLAYARDPHGLPAELARDRGSEIVAIKHGPAARTFMTIGSVASLGIYRHREPDTPANLALLDRRRRLETDEAYLRKVLSSSPQLEVAWSPSEIQQHLDDIADLKPHDRELDSGIATLVGRVFQQTRNDEIRRHSLVCLAGMNSSGARHELERVAGDHAVPDELRTLSVAYLHDPPLPQPPAPPAPPDQPKSLLGSGLAQ
jgi:hypothetical protein